MLVVQYSDQAETERASAFEKFRESTALWNQNCSLYPDDIIERGTTNQKPCMILVTDACLPFVTSGEAPLAARLLVNYELPRKKVRPCHFHASPFTVMILRFSNNITLHVKPGYPE